MNAATSVHQTLQGAVIPSSGRGGMRIQYPLFIRKKWILTLHQTYISIFNLILSS